MKKTIVLGLVVVFMFSLSFSVAFAHGGPNGNPDYYVEPGSKACMGQLASMHAQDELKGTNGLPASFAVSGHGGFGLTKGASVKETMKAFKEYCGK
ncbi:hypothetical protein C0584_03035 [Candidatus Parcubacteria bacterium]|nr:MAG: hypothetical protein C0584_03035 [Candidatus Parcubacteria bacterium]